MEITDDIKGVGSEGRKWKGIRIKVKRKKRKNRYKEETCKEMREKKARVHQTLLKKHVKQNISKEKAF